MKTYNVLFALTALFLASCGSDQVTEETVHKDQSKTQTIELTKAQFETAGILLGSIENKVISGSIAASGRLDVPPQSKVSISPPMEGFVKSMGLLPGSKVSKGQVLAVLQNQQYILLQQEYLENVGQLEFLQGEYERQKELAKENINAKKTLEQAKANYLTSKGRVEGLRARLKLINIDPAKVENGNIQSTISLYAPISGYITKVNTNLGAFVSPSDVLIELVNTGELHAELTVYEKDITSIREGQRVWFNLANESKQREAKVQLIGREIGMDRSVQIHCDLLEDDKELIPGMYLKAIIETGSAKVNAIPENAIEFFEGKPYVFVSKGIEGGNHSFEMVEVKVGNNEAGYTEVTFPSGFDVRREIVVSGAHSILAKLMNSEEEEGHGH